MVFHKSVAPYMSTLKRNIISRPSIIVSHILYNAYYPSANFYLISYSKEVLMEYITAWWHVVKVFSFVEGENRAASTGCDDVLRHTIEH